MSDELSRFFGTLNQRLEDARQAEQRAIERFFVELGPRLEIARTLERELDRQLARRFNVFDYLRTDELGLSRMIGDLLNPEGSHGQGAAFLQCLTERLGFAKDCDPSGSKVEYEWEITGGRKIDIAVKIDDVHCLAIENKANFAGDQPDQVQDYLWWLGQNYSKHLLVYLTPTGEGPSENSVSREKIEELKKEATRRLVIMPCGPSGELDDTFNDLRLPFSLADWLADCRRGCDVDRLRWFLREAETFCQRRYGGTTVTTTESSTVKDFVLAHPENMETAMAVYKSWPAIEAQIKSDFLELIHDKLKEDADLPENTKVYYDYGGEKYGSFIYICPASWPQYRDPNDDETLTCIYMEAEKKGSDWYIGVSRSTSEVHEEDRERWKRLYDAFAEYDQQGDESWPWWEGIEDKYQDWDALTPRLHQECQAGGGEITNYFVEKFKEVFDWAAPIIDGIDRR